MEKMIIEFDVQNDEVKRFGAKLRYTFGELGTTWRHIELVNSLDAMTLAELHKAVKLRENEARARIKVHLSKKWYWRETGDECDLTSAGNCEMLLGVTGDAVSVLRKLNLPNYTKYIEGILEAFDGPNRSIMTKDDE